MVIQSGPARVVDSGVATTFGGHPLVLVLELGEDNLVVELRFTTDPTSLEASVHADSTDVGYVIRCVNFNDGSGRGSATPVLLGELDEDLVFMHFRAFRHGNSPDHTVHYTFYRVRKERVGWTPTTPVG